MFTDTSSIRLSPNQYGQSVYWGSALRQLLIYLLGLIICTIVATFLIFILMRKNYQSTPLDTTINPKTIKNSTDQNSELIKDQELASEQITPKIIKFGMAAGIGLFSSDKGVITNTADSDSVRVVEVKLQLIMKITERSQFLVAEQPTEEQKQLQEFFWAAAWDEVVAILSAKTAFELKQEAIKLELKEDLKEKFNLLLDGPESVQEVLFESFKLQ